uniref:Uncharacterized protein n=1 Tax=Lactuca sativa TaxID=4236 RepID=A0A9R1XIN3_LACSA|nr:hypothetical protein LSAT_V11C400186270 [Lactuca sativa]
MLHNRVFDLEQSFVEKDLIIGKQDILINKLERENSEKASKISELQANLGGLTALFFDLKQRLFQIFGDEFQPLSAEGERTTASSSNPTNPVSQLSSERDTRPAPDANLDTFLSSGPTSTQERREKQIRVKETGKKFTDKYGDRSGNIMWRYDADKRMWVVKRKSGRIEYYEKKVDFLFWKKVDLSELIHALFHNPTNNTMAWSFKNFLEIKAKNNFEGLKTASSFTKKAKGVIDPRTNKTMVNFMWPPTKQAKRIPLPKRTLDTIQLWVYDEATTTVNELFEATVKAFTGIVAKIIDKKLWAGAFNQADVHLVEKP